MPSMDALYDFTEESLYESREVFRYFDIHGDDKIYVKEVADVLRALGQNPTQAKVDKLCEKWNQVEGEMHRITFEEFLPLYQSVVKDQNQCSSDEFVEGFSNFDREGNGILSGAELRHVLTNMGEKLSDDEADVIIRGLEDVNGNIPIVAVVNRVMNMS